MGTPTSREISRLSVNFTPARASKGRKSHLTAVSTTHYASKPYVAHGRVNRLRMAGRRAVAAAVACCTEVRAALYDLARNPDSRLAWVIAAGLWPAARIFGDAARLWCVGSVTGRVPIGGPLPHIADHVEEAIAIGRKRPDRRGARVTVRRKVLMRERRPARCWPYDGRPA
jgi:hypothetical protein